jgi:hypothetical protein
MCIYIYIYIYIHIYIYDYIYICINIYIYVQQPKLANPMMAPTVNNLIFEYIRDEEAPCVARVELPREKCTAAKLSMAGIAPAPFP